MDHIVVPAKLRELVSHLMEAVRAECDHCLHFVAIQRLDRAFGQRLIEVFIAQTARRITVAGLFLPKDREVDVGRLQNSGERDGDLLGAIVETAHTTDPEQNLGTAAFSKRFGVGWNVQPFTPLRAIGGTEGPRRRILLKRFERRLHFFREAAFVQHQTTAKFVDDVQLVDADRTLRHACTTTGAGPQLVLGQVVVEQHILQRRFPTVGAEQQRRTARHIQFARHQRRFLHQPAARVDDNLARTERLAGDVGRTGRRAATTLGAAVAVEQILPRQVIDIAGAELLDLGIQIHRAHHAGLAGPTGIAEPDVDQRTDHMQVLGIRQKIQKAEHQQRVQPVAHGVCHVCTGHTGQQRTERR